MFVDGEMSGELEEEEEMIALYKGTSLISRLIRMRTLSVYSHASWIAADNSEWEAWPGGVVHNRHWGEQHTPGTVIDLYDFVVPGSPERILMVESFLEAQEGKDYDYAGVAGFMSILHWLGVRNNGSKWFCFELITAACNAAGLTFTNERVYKVVGKDIAGSVALKYVGSRIVPDYTRSVQLQVA